MANKKSPQNPSSRNKVGSKKGFTPPKGMPTLKSSGKPTEAITAKGQKAKGLGKSTQKNRFGSKAKTPVVKAEKSGLRGFGTPAGTSIALSRPTNKGNIAKAVIAAGTLGPKTSVIKVGPVTKAGSGLESIAGKALSGPMGEKAKNTLMSRIIADADRAAARYMESVGSATRGSKKIVSVPKRIRTKGVGSKSKNGYRRPAKYGK